MALLTCIDLINIISVELGCMLTTFKEPFAAMAVYDISNVYLIPPLRNDYLNHNCWSVDIHATITYIYIYIQLIPGITLTMVLVVYLPSWWNKSFHMVHIVCTWILWGRGDNEIMTPTLKNLEPSFRGKCMVSSMLSRYKMNDFTSTQTAKTNLTRKIVIDHDSIV